MTGSMCLVEIDGSPMPADLVPLLVSALVEDSQRLPDMFSLRFRDPERIVLSKSNAKVGGKITIKVNTAASSSPKTLIEAEITALELEFDTGGTFTVIRGYDPAHRLFRDRRTVSYVQMTASDIATQVAKRASLKVGKVDSTSTVFPVVSQAGQSDWEILTQLARDTGSDLTVRNGAFSFVAAASAGSPTSLKFGEELIRFRSVLTSAQQVGKVEVRGWDVAEKRALVGSAPAKASTIDLPTVKPTDMANAFGNPTYVSTDVPYRTQNEVDQAAKALADEKASAFAEFEGVARGNPDLKAGGKVSLEGLGAPFEGTYTITSARHRFDPTTGYTTAITVTGKQDRSLLGLASGGARSRQTPPGVVIAVVTDVNDPDKMGRVKIKYPWLSDDYVSDWARVVCQGAGKERGWIALPEVGDEVLIGFELQDFDRPVVLGGLYNGVDTMPAGPNDLIDGGSGADQPPIVGLPRGSPDRSPRPGRDQGGRPAGHQGRQVPDLHRQDEHDDHRAVRRHGRDRGIQGHHAGRQDLRSDHEGRVGQDDRHQRRADGRRQRRGAGEVERHGERRGDERQRQGPDHGRAQGRGDDHHHRRHGQDQLMIGG